MADQKPLKRVSGKTKQFISTDTVPKSNLGTGSGSTGTLFLADDQTWKEALQESSESSVIANSGAANDTAQPSTSARFYNFIQLPTTGKLYMITGIEWKNGTVVAGNAEVGIDSVDAVPPTIATTLSIAFSAVVACSGASTVQRIPFFPPLIFRGGDYVPVWLAFDNNTHRRMTSTVGSSNMRKNVTFTSTPARAEGTAWIAATEQPYLKLYYREYR